MPAAQYRRCAAELSGGLDSSLVIGAAQRLFRQKRCIDCSAIRNLFAKV